MTYTLNQEDSYYILYYWWICLGYLRICLGLLRGNEKMIIVWSLFCFKAKLFDGDLESFLLGVDADPTIHPKRPILPSRLLTTPVSKTKSIDFQTSCNRILEFYKTPSRSSRILMNLRIRIPVITGTVVRICILPINELPSETSNPCMENMALLT